jgi:hypothetical protein
MIGTFILSSLSFFSVRVFAEIFCKFAVSGSVARLFVQKPEFRKRIMSWMREQLVKELKKKISGISKWNPRKIPKWNLLVG